MLLISDPSSAVNAILQSSRLNGVVRGNPGGDLVMDYIQQGQTFEEGEIVLTSGLGGRFPKGIPIGQVVEIRQRDIDVFQQAIIRPTVDLSRLELVMVVTNFDPLEDVPELLVPETVPVEGEANPLDAEAPLDSNLGDDNAVDESSPDVPSPDESSPDESGLDEAEPVGETEGGQ